MARHYSKQDVDLHPHGGRMVPAVNVKVGLSFWNCNWASGYDKGLEETLAAVRADAGYEDDEGRDTSWVTAEWLRTHVLERDDNPETERLISRLNEWACEQGWEDIQEDARQCFPDDQFHGSTSSYDGGYTPFRVEAEGRSSGWAVIPALPPLEEWDAIMLGRWRRFERYARQGADDIPYQMLWLYLMHEANDHMLRLTRARLGVAV